MTQSSAARAGMAQDGLSQVRRDNIKGFILVMIQALPIMAVVSLFPAVPKLMKQFGDVHGASFLVPMIVVIPSLCIAVLSPAAGLLVDRFGRRPVLISSLTLYAAVGMAPLVLNAISLILASRAILGIAEAGIVTVASTLIADYFGETRHRCPRAITKIAEITNGPEDACDVEAFARMAAGALIRPSGKIRNWTAFSLLPIRQRETQRLG